MPGATGHLVDLNVRQSLHQGRHRALLNVFRIAQAQLRMLIRTHHVKLVGVGHHGRVVHSTRDHAYLLLEAVVLRQFKSAKIGTLETKLTERVGAPDEQLLPVLGRRTVH